MSWQQRKRGKSKRSPPRKGNVHLMTALVEAAHCASRKKDTYLKDKVFRPKARRGHLRAVVAIAHKILKPTTQFLLATLNSMN